MEPSTQQFPIHVVTMLYLLGASELKVGSLPLCYGLSWVIWRKASHMECSAITHSCFAHTHCSLCTVVLTQLLSETCGRLQFLIYVGEC